MLRALTLTSLTLAGLSVSAQDTQPTSQPTSATSQPAEAPASQPMAEADLPEAEAIAAATENAQGAAAWHAHDSFATDIVINMGGETRIGGTVTMKTDMSRTRIDLNDGTTMIWDGETAWASPAEAATPMTRFAVLTWPWFIAAPFKMRDPGSEIESLGTQQHRGWGHTATRMTFAEGVGDSPDDWYINYHCPNTDKLLAQAYIVTYFGSEEPEPHAIEYGGFQTIDGVLLATNWNFVDWSEEEGPHGEARGNGTLTNMRFLTPDADFYTPPEGAVEAPMPSSD